MSEAPESRASQGRTPRALVHALRTRLPSAQTLARTAGPLVLVLVLGFVFDPSGAFRSWATHRALLRDISVTGILACGMTLVVIAGGIDLAVGSVLGLGAVAVSLFSMPLGWSMPLAIAAVLGIGLGTGLASGTLIAWFRVPPFVATLAMMAFARGLAKHLASGRKVTNHMYAPDGSVTSVPLPELFGWLDSRVLGGRVSIVTLLFAGCALVTYVLLRRMRLGRYLYAVGGNLEAARLSGVPVRRTQLAAYAISGLFAALAGICQAAQERQGDPETGSGFELDVIAMVVLGGTSLAGGRGGIGLTLLGVLTLGYLQKVLSLNAFSAETRLMLTGAILAGAAVLQQRSARGAGDRTG